MTLITEKKQVFNDLRIPWNKSIKDEFKREMKLNPEQDPQHVLDKICKPYMEYAFEHEAETYLAFLKERFPNKAELPRKVIKREISEEGFYTLIRENLISRVYKTDNYHLEGK